MPNIIFNSLLFFPKNEKDKLIFFDKCKKQAIN